ncbi:glutamate ligase domain-containing protein [Alicyclobacillus sp. ALC3]|uniref:glutamate ligase domain-containing protein n=1 Tax=Alicyclobacillus sp. ALC3 TaxID=2796143 RepID=UPI0023786B9F|nr:bifunctional folylpolyglutamate synthase/dihydrofolate synthase [Alicyclobacillus sp. ALC3]WDL95987.1 bifunctional folylpolyglutamate synthase/dihydrofolate synthase [Alicyclobacillus sp. ALC3]
MRTDPFMRDVIGLAYKSYNRAKSFVEGKPDREIRHPEWTRLLLDQFDRPDDTRNVMVTGSKGKGSHAILLAAILQRAGLRVGLFTGPHLVDFMERFRVDGTPIPESDFARLMRQVSQVSETLPVPEGQYIGPVGLLAVVAALWFREQSTDVNVYECGRGALHDDVNQVLHAVAVVSPIFLEHARELGPTLADVAREKAGVVTDATKFVVSHQQTSDVLTALHAACLRHGTRLEIVEAEGLQAPRVYLPGPGSRAVDVELPSGGPYLAVNAEVAAAGATAVFEVWPELARRVPTPIDLRQLQLPGRMQVVRERPLTVVDGTIHRDSARFVAAWLNNWLVRHADRQVGLVFGLPADKDVTGVLEVLCPLASFVVVAKARNPHLHFDAGVASVSRTFLADVEECTDIGDAVRAADRRLGDDDLLLVLGTQSFVGDALLYFAAPTQSLWTVSQPGGVVR